MKIEDYVRAQLEQLGYWQKMYEKPNVFGTGPTKLALMAHNIMEKKQSKKNSRTRMWPRKRFHIFR